LKTLSAVKIGAGIELCNNRSVALKAQRLVILFRLQLTFTFLSRIGSIPERRQLYAKYTGSSDTLIFNAFVKIAKTWLDDFSNFREVGYKSRYIFQGTCTVQDTMYTFMHVEAPISLCYFYIAK